MNNDNCFFGHHQVEESDIDPELPRPDYIQVAGKSEIRKSEFNPLIREILEYLFELADKGDIELSEHAKAHMACPKKRAAYLEYMQRTFLIA